MLRKSPGAVLGWALAGVILSIVSGIPVVGGIVVAVAGRARFGAALSAYLRWRRTARSASITGL